MKIVRIIGGLGNQMFQYALAVSLSKKLVSEDILIDYSCMKGYGLHNGFELSKIFNLKLRQATNKEIWKVGIPLPSYKLWQIGRRLLKRKSWIKEDSKRDYIDKIDNLSGDQLLDGAWQNEKYFAEARDAVKEAFTFPPFEKASENFVLSQRLKNQISVSVHVRRGDYLSIPNACGICTLDYYKNGISYMDKSVAPDIYVCFSDDIKWCKAEFKKFMDLSKVIFVDWNSGENSFRDMQIMSLCSHNIIANSSFSWWGAWLNDNPSKIVVAPKQWMNNGQNQDICPENWIRI